jgi:hypothetical protein
VERGEQQVPLLPSFVSAPDHAEIVARAILTTLPGRLRRAEELVHRRTLLRGGSGLHQVEVHGTSVFPGATPTLAALVP